METRAFWGLQFFLKSSGLLLEFIGANKSTQDIMGTQVIIINQLEKEKRKTWYTS